MLNRDGAEVPENTIVVFTSEKHLSNERIKNIVKKPSKKRDWFKSHFFYRCLPLTIANTYGFVISSEFDFGVQWDGGDKPESLQILLEDNAVNNNEHLIPGLASWHGHGILTVNPPFFFRTPPNVNLMTINPPNIFLPNIGVMSGVIEADNLRRNFTFNLKLVLPNIRTIIPAGTPLSGFIPVPRFYCDKFDMKFAEEVFSEETIQEELEAENASAKKRIDVEYKSTPPIGKDYLMGRDVYGNPFNNHQR